MPQHISRWEKLGLFALIAGVALILFLALEPIADTMYTVIFWVEGIIESQPLLGTLFFFALSALSAMLAFASTILLIPSAILVWGMPLTFLLLLGGWIAGAMITYWIGAKLARPILTWFIKEKTLTRYERLVSQETRFWMVLLFCLAVPSEIPGLIFGSMRYDFAKFLSAVIIAETLYAFGLIFAAQNVLDKEPISTGIIITFLIILISVASTILSRLRQK